MRAGSKICKQIVIGYTAEGKQIRKRIYADGKRELERKIEQIRDEQKRVRHPSSITFGAYAERWLTVYKSNRSINTRKMYRYALNQCEAVYGIPLMDVTRTDLQEVITSLADRPRFCQEVRLTLKQIFNTAIADGIVNTNPANGLQLPRYKPKEKRSLTLEERETIKTTALPDRERLFLDLLYYFGLRRGEALALRRSDFDFERLLLTVDKSIAFDSNRPVLKATKTEKARQVPIPSAFVLPETDEELFPNITATIFRGMWRKTESALGFDVSPHMIRHDYATRLYYVPGISTKKKAAILGHDEALFLRLYSHIDDQAEDMATFQQQMKF